MSKHEFGIMQIEPQYEERFDEFEPNKYNCIKVDDEFIEPILIELESVNCYWHTLQVEGKGIAYCGITLIPPESMDSLMKILVAQNKLEYNELILLCKKAREENKYIIHFGI